jgi:predicted nucleic acid-binding protein
LGLKELLRQLQGKLIAIDTAPFIYFLEIFPKYSPLVDHFFEALERGEMNAVTSVLTLVEVLVQPIRRRNSGLAGQYRQILLSSDHLQVAPVSLDIAEEAARLRAKFNLRTPDAIQFASAITSNADFFFTNDMQFLKVSGEGPEVLVLDLLLE